MADSSSNDVLSISLEIKGLSEVLDALKKIGDALKSIPDMKNVFSDAAAKNAERMAAACERIQKASESTRPFDFSFTGNGSNGSGGRRNTKSGTQSSSQNGSGNSGGALVRTSFSDAAGELGRVFRYWHYKFYPSSPVPPGSIGGDSDYPRIGGGGGGGTSSSKRSSHGGRSGPLDHKFRYWHYERKPESYEDVIDAQFSDEPPIDVKFRNLDDDQQPAPSNNGKKGNRWSDIWKAFRMLSSGFRLYANKGGQGIRASVSLGTFANMIGSGNPTIMAMGTAALMFGSLAIATHAAVEAMNQFTTSMAKAGTQSLNKMGQATGIGALLGMNDSDIASAAARLQKNLGTSGSIGQLMGFANGLEDLMGNNPMFGKVDRLQNFFKFIDRLRAMSDENATRFARAEDMEDFLPIRNVSDKTFQQMKQIYSQLHSSDEIQIAMEWNVMMAKIKFAFSKLMSLIMTYGEQLISFFEWITKPFYDFQMWLSGNTPGASPNNSAANASAQQSLQQNSEAIQRNTDALDQHLNGMKQIFGGGQFATAAWPNGMRGMSGYENMKNERLVWGSL